MFSPYYAWARRRPGRDPLEHSAVNAVLYGPRKHWAMTERGRGAVRRDATALQIGPSALRWDGAGLDIRLDEITVPLPGRIRGTIRVEPRSYGGLPHALDAAGRHRWQPFAPLATITVDLERPELRWSGSAYLDINRGDEPLEAAFTTWDWSRTVGADGTGILYDVSRRAGDDLSIALHVDRHGAITRLDPPPPTPLAASRWGLRRTTRADAGHTPRLVKRFEDGPFYARSLIASQIGGRTVTAVHETLSLDRFRRPWVQAMLPFRMPRAWR